MCKLDLKLNNLQGLICHKNQPTNQNKIQLYENYTNPKIFFTNGGHFQTSSFVWITKHKVNVISVYLLINLAGPSNHQIKEDG